MAVVKRLTCKDCGKVWEVGTLQRVPADCPVCGGKREYSDKWYVVLSLPNPTGGPRIRYNKAWSEKKAEAQAHEAEKKNGKAALPAASFLSLAEDFEQWIDNKVAGAIGKKMALGSATSYKSRLNVHLKPYFKKYDDCHQITEAVVNKYRAGRLKVAKPASVNREVGTLKRLLNIAVKGGKLNKNPLAGVEMLDEENKRERFLTLKEIRSLLAECANISGRCCIATQIALNTGLRHEGVVTLRWDEIDEDAGKIVKVVKNKTTVTIPLNPQLKTALEEWKGHKQARPEGEWVIPSPQNPEAPMLVTSNFGFNTACRRAGITRFTFHDLRHTFATHFIKHTKDIHLTAKILGHSTTYITERYAHLLDDEAEKAMQGFSYGDSDAAAAPEVEEGGADVEDHGDNHPQ